MLTLLEVTTLLKNNGINSVASQLKVKKADIYNFLKNNGLVYADGEVKTIIDNNNEVALTKVIQKDKQSDNKPSESIIQKYNKDIDIDTLKELISLIEPIKEVIQEYNKSKNIIEVERVELKPPSVTEVKQKLFKVDIEVLEKWNKFIAEHKEFKVQSLISLALEEFIQKYSK
jgi:hypothetical protein